MKNNFKSAREAKGLTQKECADKLDISLRAWQTYEQGVSEPKQELLCKIADMFGASIDYLLGREPAPDPFGDVDLSTADEREVFEKYMSLPEHIRAVLLDVLIQLADAARARRELANRPVIMTIKRHINKAAAGSGYDLADHDQWERVTVVQTDEAERADFAVEVDGDSMLPEYHNGDLALIVLADDVEVGQVGLFMQNGKGYIKQKGERYLISINPDYPNIYPEDGEIVCRGRVIGIAELPE